MTLGDDALWSLSVIAVVVGPPALVVLGLVRVARRVAGRRAARPAEPLGRPASRPAQG